MGDPLADTLAAELSAMPPGHGRRILNQALEEGVDAVPYAPPGLVAFFQHLEDVPAWVDWQQLDRGGEAFLRAGPAAAWTLMIYALPLAYASPAGNKPLALSGRLLERAKRRLAETARYVVETCRPGGLRRDRPGFKIAVRVRLMHAQMRRLLMQSGKWRKTEWGTPICQLDLAGTNLLFSVIVLDGMRRLGFRLSPRESDDVLQLWRYAGLVMGVDPGLCFASEADARRLGGVIQATQGPPDADAVELVQALMARSEVGGDEDQALAPRLAGLNFELARYLIGDELADQLRYPRSKTRWAIPLVRGLLFVMSTSARAVPALRRRSVALGTSVWERTIERGMMGATTAFEMPSRLR